MAVVILEGVTRAYPSGSLAVDNLNLEVRDHELLVLLGPSGCGKSTTLRMIAGLEEITSGTIRIGEKVVNQVAPRDRDIAMVFQNYALYPHMTVRRNLAFGLELRSGGGWLTRGLRRMTQPAEARRMAALREEIGPRVAWAAGLLGIEHLLDRLPGQLSGGERQRVALGRAIVRQPVAFLFDEPLSNLDARLRLEMRRELKQLHDRLRVTTIYVTHDQVEAMTLGERIAIMRGGRLQQLGAPLDVYDRPANRFVAAFLGTPPMNLLDGSLVSEGEGTSFRGTGWEWRLPGGAWRPPPAGSVTMGVRPEDMLLDGAGLLSGEVTLVETLGDVQLLHVRLGENEVTIKSDSRTRRGPGEIVRFGLRPDRLHWFEMASGERLSEAE